MSETEQLTRESIDVLMREYAILKAEIGTHISFYKGHVSKLQLMGSAILAGAAYVIANAALLPGAANWWWWWAIAILIPIMTNYLLFDIIESQYAMILLGERMATIEEDVNGMAGRRLLIWESYGAPRFWQGFRPMKGVINPDWFLSILGMLVAGSIGVGPSAILFARLWDSTGGSLLRAVAAGAILFVALGTMCLSMVIGTRILLEMRGRPRTFFRRVLSTPLGEAVREED